MSAQSRHLGSSILPRHSMPTIRTIMPNRMASSGRYSAENTVAYHTGNAANIAAPAVINHTSLPSHTGPIVFSAARRWRSAVSCPPPSMFLLAAPNGIISMPTPKSNPSRIRNPRNSAAMRKNHSSCSPIRIHVLSARGGQ